MVSAAPSLRCAVLALIAVAPFSGVALAQPRPASEAEVKAAFVYHFGKYVEWPAEAMKGRERMAICVLGDDAFARTLESALRTKTIHEKPVAVRRVAAAGRFDGCQILFIGDAAAERLPSVLDAVRGQPILTVGNTAQLAAAGAMIGFTFEQDKVRFLINASAVERGGLKISSQVMKLAVTVVDPPHGDR
jgi:hypothetical protein